MMRRISVRIPTRAASSCVSRFSTRCCRVAVATLYVPNATSSTVMGTVISRYWRSIADMPNIDAPMTSTIEYLRTEAKYSPKPGFGISPLYGDWKIPYMSSMRRTRSSVR